MTTFATIDITNLTVAFHATSDDASHVSDQRDHYLATCAEDLTDLSGPVLVALYNATAAELATNITPVNKFSGKEAGARRLWANLVDLCDVRKAAAEAALKAAAADKARDKAKPAKATDYPATTKAPRRNTGINLAPKATVYACKEGTKQALFVDLLSRPQGATMEELMVAMSTGKPWQEITVKSGLNWDMNKVKGYGIRTSKRGDVDCYHLVLPAGMASHVPHTPRKSAGEDLVKRIKDWATANYSKSYGASALLETLTDAEMVQEFKTLKDARDWAKLQDEAHQNAQG
jgi:hypothetical protein